MGSYTLPGIIRPTKDKANLLEGASVLKESIYPETRNSFSIVATAERNSETACLTQNQVQGTVYVNPWSALCLMTVKIVNKLFSI